MKSISFVMDFVTRPGQTHPHQLLKYWSLSAPAESRSRKIIRKIYTLMTAFRWVATTRESSSLLTCWLSIITIWNEEFANLDQIFILEMNSRGVIFYHYLDVVLDLFDLVLKILIIKIIWASLCEMVFPRTEIIDNFVFNSKSENLWMQGSDRNGPFVSVNTTEWDYVILQDNN